MIPQLIWIILTFTGFGISLSRHGDMTTINANHSLISIVIHVILLYWGGFFS